MSFKGRYDGGGYVIRNLPMKETRIDPLFGFNIKNTLSIFSDIQSESKIVDMILEGCSLAQSANGSVIERCQSTDSLIGSAENCQISSCGAGLDLIKESIKNSNITDCNSAASLAKNAVDCEFDLCQASDRMIKESATNCQIKNCAVIFSGNDGMNINGGIAKTLTNSSVECCFVAAAKTYRDLYGAIAYESKGQNAIRNCAIGPIQLNPGYSVYRIIYRLSNETILENNAAIDTIKGKDDANGIDGKTVAAAIFKQRYFEHTLGWDFVNIWEWDAKNNRPTLRSIATVNRQESSDTSGDTEDLLIQQIRSNIWL
jgi:MoxR-like ATPase